MRRSTIAGMCALAALVAPAAAEAQELTTRDRQLHANFDANAGQIERIGVDRVDRRALAQFVVQLRGLLDQVSAGGKDTDAHRQRVARLATFEAAVTGTPPGGNRPAGGPPASRPFDQPRPAATPADRPPSAEAAQALQAFQSYLDAHRAGLEEPTGRDELELRCQLLGLEERRAELARLAPEASCLETRVAAWEIKRLTHGLDGAFGRPTEVPWGSPERDRLISLEQELAARLWNSAQYRSRRGPWQLDPQVVAWVEEQLAGFRAELDGLRPKFGRGAHYLAAEYAHRQAVERLPREIEAARARAAQEAADQAAREEAARRATDDEAARAAAETQECHAELARFRELFPLERFDPSFQGDPTPEHVRRWGQQLRALNEALPRAQQFIDRWNDRRYRARDQEFLQFAGWFRAQARDRVERALRDFRGRHSAGVGYADRAASRRVDANTYQQELDRMLREIAEGEAGLRALLALSEGLTGTADPALARDLQAALDTRTRLQADFQRFARERRLPDAVEEDPALLALGRSLTEQKMGGRDNVRGLRITLPRSRYETEEETATHIITRWFESFRVDFAGRRPGEDRWYHEAFTIVRRLDSGGTPAGEWYLSMQSEPSFQQPILLENVQGR